MELSETRYAQSGDTAIAYATVGEGPVDLVLTPGAASHVELTWQHPLFAAFLDRMASFGRVIVFDKRGTGLSDRVKKIATLEERSDDIRAVMDAAGSERAVLMGVSEGGPMSVLFAATYPKRTAGLVLYGSRARQCWAPDYPWRPTEDEFRRWIREEEQSPSPITEESTRAMLENFAPSLAGDAEFARWWAMVRRSSISPGASLDLARMNMEIDVRDVLATIRVPTLVVQLAGDRLVKAEEGRYLAEHIPGARYRELPGDNHLVMADDSASRVRHPRGRGVRGRPAGRRARAGHGPRHRAVHRSRRLDGDSRRAGRPPLARAARTPPRSRPQPTLPLPRPSRSTPPATDSSPPSTAPRGRSAAPAR